MAGILKMLDGTVDIYVTDFKSRRRTSDSGLRETPGKDSRAKNESCSVAAAISMSRPPLNRRAPR